MVAKFTADTSGFDAGIKRATAQMGDLSNSADFMQGVLRGMEKELAGVNRTTAQTSEVSAIAARSYAILNGETEKVARSHRMAHAAMIPLGAAIVQTTAYFKDQGPAIAAVVGAVDNLVISIGATALATGSLSRALSMFLGPMGLVTAAIVAASAALSYFIGKQQEAKKAQEEAFRTLEKTVDLYNQINRETAMAGAVTPQQKAQIEHQQNLLRIRQLGLKTADEEVLRAAEEERFRATLGSIARDEATARGKEIDATRKGLAAEIDTLRATQMGWTESAAAVSDFLLVQGLVRQYGQNAVREFEKERDALFSLNSAIEDHNKRIKDNAEAYKNVSTAINQAERAQTDYQSIALEVSRLGMDELSKKLSEIDEKYKKLMVDMTKASLATGAPMDFGIVAIAQEIEKADAILADTVKRINAQAPTGVRSTAGITPEEITRTYEQMFDSIGNGMQSTVQGVMQGTQTVGEAFRRMGQNIALSLAEVIVQLGVLNPLKNAIFGGMPGFRPGVTLGDLFSGSGGVQQLAGPAEEGFFSWLGGFFGGAQHGGTIAGLRGRPVPIMAHAGEKIIPLSQADKERGGGKTVVNINGDIIPRNNWTRPQDVVQIVHQQFDDRSLLMQTLEQRISRRS